MPLSNAGTSRQPNTTPHGWFEHSDQQDQHAKRNICEYISTLMNENHMYLIIKSCNYLDNRTDIYLIYLCDRCFFGGCGVLAGSDFLNYSTSFPLDQQSNSLEWVTANQEVFSLGLREIWTCWTEPQCFNLLHLSADVVEPRCVHFPRNF